MAPHLLLASRFPPMAGGTARWLGALARHYPVGELVVSTGQGPDGDDVDEPLPNRVERVAVPAARLRSLTGMLVWSRQAAVLARVTGAEFTWCGDLAPSGHAARWVRERVGLPFGVLAHAHEFAALRHAGHRSRLKLRSGRQLLRAASVIVADREWTAELVRSVGEELGVPLGDDRVRVVPSGTDPARFHPGVDAAAVRRRHDLDGAPWLLTSAHLVPLDGLELVLRALQAVPAARCAVLVDGRTYDGAQRLVRDLGLVERVRLLDSVPEADLPALYGAVRACVGLSREAGFDADGTGMSFVEAAASGIPLVAVGRVGLPALLDDGVSGVVVDEERPEALAAALQGLLADPDRALRLGRAARARVERDFTWDRTARALHGIAREVARRGRESGGA
ncbi:MAG: glycosyltransferase family 4 protein [Gemmatimonadales bacterium]|nr:glycosyltransferase family 4 protein [Gemmatimonadales bacterium]